MTNVNISVPAVWAWEERPVLRLEAKLIWNCFEEYHLLDILWLTEFCVCVLLWIAINILECFYNWNKRQAVWFNLLSLLSLIASPWTLWTPFERLRWFWIGWIARRWTPSQIDSCQCIELTQIYWHNLSIDKIYYYISDIRHLRNICPWSVFEMARCTVVRYFVRQPPSIVDVCLFFHPHNFECGSFYTKVYKLQHKICVASTPLIMSYWFGATIVRSKLCHCRTCNSAS